MDINMIIQNMIEGSIFAVFMGGYIELKRKSIFSFILIFTIIYSLCLSCLNYVMEYEGFFCIIYTFLAFIVLQVFNQKEHPIHWQNILIYLLLWNMLGSITAEITILVHGLVFHMSYAESLSILNSYFIFITSKIIVGSGLYFVNLLTKKYKHYYSQYTPFFLIIFTFLFITITNNEAKIFVPTSDYLELILINLGLFLTAMSSYYLFNKSSYDTLLSFENAQLKDSIKSIQATKDLYQEDEQRLKTLKHDLKNQLIVVNEYLKKGNVERGMELISKDLEEIEQTPFSLSSGFSAIDAILTGKLSRANRNGIHTTVTISLSQLSDDLEYHMAIVLGNLIDNAIENISAEKPSIRVSLSQKKNIISIVVTNTTDNTDQTFQTKKKESDNHGIGMSSINIIVKMYSGVSVYLLENGVFKAYIKLYDNPEKLS